MKWQEFFFIKKKWWKVFKQNGGKKFKKIGEKILIKWWEIFG